MSEFAIGQRWLSETEIELGLGIVTSVSGRQVTLLFPASGESRAYASSEAPLTRYRLETEDESKHSEGWAFTVTSVDEADGILIYQGTVNGEGVIVPETQLHYQVQLSNPLNRLLAGQVDRVNQFDLRQVTHQHLQSWLNNPARGLLGARIDLLPHQLYIGANVGSRQAPRVLLADEVGLGKTIEAGLIMQHQLINGLASRILIQVPDSLLHQWMVELRRRFNLFFTILDESYCEASDEDGNPFEQAQLVLCPASLLQQDKPAAMASEASWDLTVVDEAHQMSDNDRATLRRIAGESGLLLLTATPDQAGADSHFAQLNLLDPKRFHSVEKFRQEQANYQQVADQAAQLERAGDADSQRKLEQLLDEHGTGRVLMRNTRAHVKGFPQRNYTVHSLPSTDHSDDALEQKVDWLHNYARTLSPEKILVLMQSQQQVEEAAALLRVKYGRHCALFHEDMTLIERDRAAEFFADEEDGAQLLLSSEVGGEGRNFQFASHLVMLDLPLHPDRLEQRIGRLDRIGQGPSIEIAVPVTESGFDQRLARWYDEGMQAFTQPNATGHRLMQILGDDIEIALQSTQEAFDSFIARTRSLVDDIRHNLALGRDRLLELNSCRPQPARRLQDEISNTDAGTALPAFMFEFWDHFGVEVEDKDDKRLIIKPGQHFAANGLPGLDEEGSVITFDREAALRYDDVQFLTWEHPQVQTAIELILNENFGTSSVAILKNSALPPGHWFLEAIFTASLPEAPVPALQRAYPTAPLRFLLDSKGNNLDQKIGAAVLNRQLHFVNKKSAAQMVKALHKPVQQLIKSCWEPAEAQLLERCKQEGAQVTERLSGEIERLRSLQASNPSIRDDEIVALEKACHEMGEAYAAPQLSLDSLRLIVNAGPEAG